MQLITSSDGIEVAVHDLGGDGPPILLAHATGLHGRCWEPVASRIDGHRLIAFDFRGHGDSSKPLDHDYAWTGFAEDVLAVVDALDLDRPFGVGHSKGGASLLMAEEARPGTFAGLWCFDPVVFPTALVESAGAPNPLAEGAERRRAVFPSRAEAFANFRDKPPFSVVTEEALHAYVDHGFADQPDGSVALKCPPSVEAQVYRMGPQNRAFADLDRVPCPVTIARAEVDGFGPSAFAEAIVDALPHGRLEDHPELTHFGPLQDPDRIAASIARAARPAG